MKRSLVLRLFLVIALAVIGVLGVEWGIRFLFPGISSWISLAMNILVAALTASVATVWLARFYDQLNQKIGQEIAKRKRLEGELSQLGQEFEDHIKDKTAQLARLNLDLDLEIAQHKQAEETALANEERFRNMADNVQEGLTIIEDGEVVYINQSAWKIFGNSPEEGEETPSNRLDLVSSEEMSRLIRMSEDAFRLYDSSREDEYWIVRKDGTRRCIHNRYSYTKARGVERRFIVSSDITDQALAYQMLEQAVDERTRELSTVLEISKKITSTLELEPLLQVVVEQIKSIIPYSSATICTLRDGQLEEIAYQSPGQAGQAQPLRLSLSNAELYEEVIQQQKVLVIDDVKGDTPLARALAETSDGLVQLSFGHAHSWMGIPLVVKDRAIGLLSLTHEKPNFYTQVHIRSALAIANQIAIAMENARLYEQAHDLATLEERQRIAGELHDSVTQLLYGIGLYSAAAGRSVRESNLELTEQIVGEIKENALQALREMRLLIYELHPPVLEDLGLVAALQASLDSVKVRTGLHAELKAEGIDRLPVSMECELYRVALEALNNLVKYAKAKRVNIDLRLVDNVVTMEICDNGMGFDLAAAKASGGFGLRNMELRVKQICGNLEIDSLPGCGTRIRVEVPVRDCARVPSEISSNVEV
ncbi:MAG: GAF domain-containing protein [Chloroflexi bacterium]|nr:GAF domain-containing protein [Chloroflexota bacterium]